MIPISDSVKRVLWTFGQTFASVFLLGIFGVLQPLAEAVSSGNVPDFGAAGSALFALVGAAGAAALSAAKNAIFPPGAKAR